MIISLRGTNGSGKSTIVREIMKCYPTVIRLEYPGRKKPSGYICQRLFPHGRYLHVPGHYEIANGGVDTLPSLEIAYDLIEEHYLLGMDVLYEGKNMSDGTTKLLSLHERGLKSAVALIDEPVKKCLASVRKRGHNIKHQTIERLHAKSRRDVDALEKAGVEIYRGNRAAVLAQVKRWLGL